MNLSQIVLLLFFSVQVAHATTFEIPVQKDIDNAFSLILSTNTGRAICRDILGGDPDALHLHLGISRQAATQIATNCGNSQPSEWIYPTSPNDIMKMRPDSAQPRAYKVLHSDQSFPIESWTDPRSNSTTILTNSDSISFARLVQILSHETAVYFDSKSNPLHKGAEEIPHLRELKPSHKNTINPLFAVSNPMQAHTLTYLRALQVEFAILRELVERKAITAPNDLSDPYLNHLVSDKCQQECIVNLIESTRQVYLPFSLQLLAFSPHYRGLARRELIELHSNSVDEKLRQSARYVFNDASIKFIRREFTGDVVADLSRAFAAVDKGDDETVYSFLQNDLWPIEKAVLAESRFGTNGITLLEFMKRPLMSGYNILLSSGPRVRVRTGIIE